VAQPLNLAGHALLAALLMRHPTGDTLSRAFADRNGSA
jgi:hypothetical protein